MSLCAHLNLTRILNMSLRGYRVTDSEIELPDLLLLHVENFPPFPITITLVTILLVHFQDDAFCIINSEAKVSIES